MNCCACLLLYTLLLSCLRCLWFKSWHEPRSGLRANHFSKQSFQRDSLRDRTRASPMLSPQNQRNRALQRAFQSTTAFSVLASAGGSAVRNCTTNATRCKVPFPQQMSQAKWGALQELVVEATESQRDAD